MARPPCGARLLSLNLTLEDLSSSPRNPPLHPAGQRLRLFSSCWRSVGIVWVWGAQVRLPRRFLPQCLCGQRHRLRGVNKSWRENCWAVGRTCLQCRQKGSDCFRGGRAPYAPAPASTSGSASRQHLVPVFPLRSSRGISGGYDSHLLDNDAPF